MPETHLIPYELALAIHIIAVIAWIAGMLMLPRFYAYVSASQPGGELETVMLKNAGRLRHFILTPAMLLAWVMGIYLFKSYVIGDWDRTPEEIIAAVPGWFWVKFALVVGLSAFHGFCTGQWRKLSRGERKHSERFWRMASEIPFVVVIAVVLLVKLKPF